jgi:biotin operon repressor
MTEHERDLDAVVELEFRRTQFAMVPEWVDERVTDATAMRLYVRLARKYASAGGRTCYPSQRTLAEELAISERTVKRAMAHLVDAGAVVAKRTIRDGRLNRNVYWLPLELADDGSPVALRGDQGEQVNEGSNMAPRRGVKYGPSTNQTQKKNQRKTPDAGAPEGQEGLDLGVASEPPVIEDKSAEKPRTVNQRAVLLAQAHYDRLGKMGNVPAMTKIIRKALERNFTDARVNEVLVWLADRRWTLTEERLANALRGGPLPAGKTAPAAAPKARTGRMELETF